MTVFPQIEGNEAYLHELPPRTWPEIAGMRQDSAEQRIAQLEQRVRILERMFDRLLIGDESAEAQHD